ncbi:bifunctional 3-(3-hydroxy-phenyl)propionate/3-hydroxycinnamic acid hydroxylase [Polaromonas sp.]|uniref:bifunctional 3-(3-hydroxy-phenyl)propionate/3-hydroxycinnamic acid hydroxylase n=1 Tax=Polaromonas sp. TaxID=1869339 RepID=UPI003BA8C50C
MSATSPPFDTDVVIVGYGPSGVSAANFLGAYGMRAIAFERDKGIYPRARAVTVNDWTLRCFQSAGLDGLLLRDMEPTRVIRWRTYDGRELGRTAIRPSTLGHHSANIIYQPVMEQTLRDGVLRHADKVEVRYGYSVTSLEQDSEGVTVTAHDAQTGQTSTTRARYVLACDGGSSSVRSQLGIALVGSTLDTKWVVIDARVKRWWSERNLHTFWSDKKRPVVDIPLALGNHRWEFPLEPQESESDFATPEQLWKLLHTMGITEDHIEIHQHAFYRHHVRHAQRWRSGRVFLLGDAAHMMPPWAGQGMQSGIRDAFNICWKLREVIAGRLPESLLDTYEPERAPNVAMLTQASEQLGRIVKMQLSRKERWLYAFRELLGRLHVPMPLHPRFRPPFLNTGWLRGPVGIQSAVGKMIPQPMVCTPQGKPGWLDTLLGNGFTLLGDGVDPASLLEPEEKARWDALGARYLAVRSGKVAAVSDTDVIDLDGTLLAWMRKQGTQAIALRPDRFVAAAQGSGLDVPSWTETPPSGRSAIR